MSEKPLFVPLQSRWYFAFEHRIKKFEVRIYGPRWNEKTCRVGRDAVLSRGYGKANRLAAEVVSFEKLKSYKDLPDPYRGEFLEVFGDRDDEIAFIGLDVKGPA